MPMLTKVIAIKNVGRFISSAAQPNPMLSRRAVIFAANAYGKTTFCAILRSLQTGDASFVLGRKTIGVAAAPEIELLFSDGNRRFRNGSWGIVEPRLSIFDSVFVADSVHSGDVVDVTHRRNLYRVIIGKSGIALAEEEQELSERSRTKQGELTAAEKALQASIPQGVSFVDFIGFELDPEIDQKIGIQAQLVESLRQAENVRNRQPLEPLQGTSLDVVSVERLLAITIDLVGQDAEAEVMEHVARHRMLEGGREWVAKGAAYGTGDQCPFCGRDGITALSIVRAYRALFGDAYQSLQADIGAARKTINDSVGSETRMRFAARVANNAAAIEFWSRLCAINGDSFPSLDAITASMEHTWKPLNELVEKKASAPLERVVDDDAIRSATQELATIGNAIQSYNEAVATANQLINEQKKLTAARDQAAANFELRRLQAIKRRHEQPAIDACDLYRRTDAEKKELERRKTAVRKQLEGHSETVVEPYERRINHFLGRFNAGFGVAKTGHTYSGGIATSTYQLLINARSVDVGDAKTPPDRASFKNTLSSSDRQTLALAFFLAHLEREPDLGDRIVVFDDPFSSQDSFRRNNTIHEILSIASRAAQTIVLSHDPQFLKQLWEWCPAAERTALQITYHRETGSKLREFDIEDACRGRAAAEQDKLLAYRATGVGEPRAIIKMLRVVIETHFRGTYSGWFDTDDNLGAILQKIRTRGNLHPAHHSYEELNRINEYTANYHHGEDPGASAEPPIDETELQGFVEDTLRLVNALAA